MHTSPTVTSTPAAPTEPAAIRTGPAAQGETAPTTVLTSSPPRIAYDDTGPRRAGSPTLMFLPGWCGPRTLFRGLLSQRAPERRAVAVDLRGHGESEPGPDDFGYDEILDDTVRVLDEAGIDRVIPVAVSHAGWAAIDLRRRLGSSRVPGIVLVDWMVLGAPPPFAGALAGLQDPQAWRAVRDGLFGMWSTGVDVPALRDFIDQMGASEGAMWARAGREIARRFAADPVPLDALARETAPCPTLHLYAQPADPAYLAAQRAYAAAHPWFSVHRLSATSHFPMFEVPIEMSARIEAFARTVGSR